MSLVIAFGGPPHSGKSVFVAALYARTLALTRGNNEVFWLPANPDGEGIWFHEIPVETALELRVPQQFTDEFRSSVIDAISTVRGSIALTLVDLGGRVGSDTEAFLSATDGVVLLCSPDCATDLDDWRLAAKRTSTPILAEFSSVLCYTCDDAIDSDARGAIDLDSTPARGTLVNLVRGGAYSSCYTNQVNAFADWLRKYSKKVAMED